MILFKKIIFQESVHTFQIDFNRHVSNIVYIQWMEIGRLKFLQKVGQPIEKIDKDGFFPVLTETQISYRRPLFLGENVEIELWIAELTGVYACIEFLFKKIDGSLVATARQKCVFVDSKTNKIKRLTDREHYLFLPYLKRIVSN